MASLEQGDGEVWKNVHVSEAQRVNFKPMADRLMSSVKSGVGRSPVFLLVANAFGQEGLPLSNQDVFAGAPALQQARRLLVSGGVTYD